MTMTADAVPPVDTGTPQTLGQSPLNTKGEPRKSGPRGGRPRKTPEERAADANERAAQKATGARVDPSVTQALSVLNAAYTFMVTGLTVVGARQAASDLESQIPAVQSQNRQFLSADPRLAQRIASIGSSTGRAGFLVANLMVLAGVGVTAAAEIGATRAATRPPRPKPTPTAPERTVFDGEGGEPTTPAASPLFPGGI